jgi:hypothetical protein
MKKANDTRTAILDVAQDMVQRGIGSINNALACNNRRNHRD